MKNSFSIDLEDWFQGTDQIKLKDFHKYEDRIEKSTNRLLEIMDFFEVKSTFFVLGYVAKKHPALIRKIFDKGHEIATHGYSHEIIYKMSPELFRKELLLSKNILEDITGHKVIGHRASNWSITKKSLWALDILKDEGFKYDSSIYPTENYLFGIEGSPLFPYTLENGLIEIPPSVMEIGKKRLPFAGGFFLRSLPFFILNMGIKNLNKQNQVGVIYLHPWEIDTKQSYRLPLSWKNWIIHYFRLGSTESKIKKLFEIYEFDRMDKLFLPKE